MLSLFKATIGAKKHSHILIKKLILILQQMRAYSAFYIFFILIGSAQLINSFSDKKTKIDFLTILIVWLGMLSHQFLSTVLNDLLHYEKDMLDEERAKKRQYLTYIIQKKKTIVIGSFLFQIGIFALLAIILSQTKKLQEIVVIFTLFLLAFLFAILYGFFKGKQIVLASLFRGLAIVPISSFFFLWYLTGTETSFFMQTFPHYYVIALWYSLLFFSLDLIGNLYGDLRDFLIDSRAGIKTIVTEHSLLTFFIVSFIFNDILIPLILVKLLNYIIIPRLIEDVAPILMLLMFFMLISITPLTLIIPQDKVHFVYLLLKYCISTLILILVTGNLLLVVVLLPLLVIVFLIYRSKHFQDNAPKIYVLFRLEKKIRAEMRKSILK